MKPELIIFDCDGVLVDSEIIKCRVDARELGKLGFRLTVEEVAVRFVGRRTQDMLDTLAAEQGISPPPGFRDHLLAAVLDSFERELKPVANIGRALDEIRTPVCVASSSDVDRIARSLDVTGLRRYFGERIFSAQMVEHGKPAPDLYLHAAHALGVAPAACIVIEDAVTGVQAGVAAGMRVFGYYGASHCVPGHDRRLRAAGAVAAFDDMAALPALISSQAAHP